MNTPVSNVLFSSFVADCGGRQQAAEKLNCSYQLVCHILTGERGISKDIAELVENVSDGKYCKAALIWGD